MSVHVARSRNGGESFDPPTHIVPSNLNLNAHVPVVLSDGTLLASFVDFQRNVDNFRGRGMLERSRIWMLRSTDGGYSFSIPLLANEGCQGSSMTADTTAGSPFRDRVYLACRQRRSGAIVVNYSTDAGEIWTDPVRVHSAAADTIVLRAQPAVAVNRDGVLGVTWIDGRVQPGNRCQQIYFAASLDGGRTFLPERVVSSERSCPDSTINGAAYARWRYGGDYFGMTAGVDGRFHVLWSDARRGAFQLWTAAIEVTGSAAPPK
jgi:hypothetical protein